MGARHSCRFNARMICALNFCGWHWHFGVEAG
jgi:hypothetical protein